MFPFIFPEKTSYFRIFTDFKSRENWLMILYSFQITRGFIFIFLCWVCFPVFFCLIFLVIFQERMSCSSCACITCLCLCLCLCLCPCKTREIGIFFGLLPFCLLPFNFAGEDIVFLANDWQAGFVPLILRCSLFFIFFNVLFLDSFLILSWTNSLLTATLWTLLWACYD